MSNTPVPTEKISLTKGAEQQPLFSGHLTKSKENLKIFKLNETDELNGIENNFVYYEAGIFNRSELKDYTRIVAIRPPEGPGQSMVFVLATKDFKSYFLNNTCVSIAL